MKLSRFVSSFGAVIALAGITAGVRAEPIYGIVDSTTPTLVMFDSATPGLLTSVGSITGLLSGQRLSAIDFRPASGQLYALSSSGASAQLYTINTSTFAATAIGSGLTLTGNTSTRISIDFNPVVDALRIVTGSGLNFRVNPTTGALIAQDTSLTPSSSVVSATAYSNNVRGASVTTLYAYDFINDTIDTIGGVNGSPSPNTGVLTSVGSSGLTSVTTSIGFDISGTSGIAYLSLDDASTPNANTEFYSVSLATGAATLIGNSPIALLDIAAAPRSVPEPSTCALLFAGCGILTRALRRRRRDS